ncbi:4,5-DOPA dioxygenase extradiol [Candidatus Gracilibacteria bacterium]|nr:4,5-DOPA dioxygenase extradiol [Candidatus Gracilibacteria bacterium]
MQTMPIIFIGHGSPMNAIETNTYSESWRKIGNSISKPRAILMLSAHWITSGETRISTSEHPSMIYDMGGFPDELYKVEYRAKGSRSIAEEIKNHIKNTTSLEIQEDPTRGLDHGSWSILLHLFPHADIPVISMSLDYIASPESLFLIGKELSALRERGILIVGSGNIVHNLGMIDWSGKTQHPWAQEFDKKIETLIKNNDFGSILHFQEWGNISRLAHPSYDHLLPLFPLLGATNPDDMVQFLTPDIVMGSLSMRSIIWSGSK